MVGAQEIDCSREKTKYEKDEHRSPARHHSGTVKHGLCGWRKGVQERRSVIPAGTTISRMIEHPLVGRAVFRYDRAGLRYSAQ